ncbi:MAG: hypothetical protein Q4F54_02800 [Coriobacteriia bacterium]|nr:hypothetical protein [Coriobacteriia bacterium]
MKKIRNFTLLFSILFLGLMFVACAPIDDATTNGSSYNTSDSAGPMNCAIIYSEHSNSTKSISGLEKYIHGAKEASGYLGIVKLDGSPSVISNISEQTKMNSENETRQKGEIAEYVNNKMDELNKVKAEKEEVDILGSFKVANECFKKANNNDLENTVVFVGSGISTKGAIDFTSTGLDSLNLNDYIS